MTIMDIRPAEDRAALLQSVALPYPVGRRAGAGRQIKRDGSQIEVEVYAQDILFSGRPARLNLAHDITDRVRAEQALQAKSAELQATTQQLWQAARLATVGELAAGIAHELNNPLAIIQLRIEALLGNLPEGAPERRPLTIVGQEAERMARLVANLLQNSRRGTQEGDHDRPVRGNLQQPGAGGKPAAPAPCGGGVRLAG